MCSPSLDSFYRIWSRKIIEILRWCLLSSDEPWVDSYASQVLIRPIVRNGIIKLCSYLMRIGKAMQIYLEHPRSFLLPHKWPIAIRIGAAADFERPCFADALKIGQTAQQLCTDNVAPNHCSFQIFEIRRWLWSCSCTLFGNNRWGNLS